MGAVLVAAAMGVAAVGVVRDIRRSASDKGPNGGPGGTLRSSSWAGFGAGLPFYLVAVLLLLLAA